MTFTLHLWILAVRILLRVKSEKPVIIHLTAWYGKPFYYLFEK
jgi:hypothetical protein